MTTFAWPAVLKPRDFGFFFLDADTSGGAALGGGEQIVFSPGPRWGAAMTLTIKNKEELLELRSLRTNLRGRANPIAMPNFDGRHVSWPVDAVTGVILTPKVTRNRDLDGTAYADPEIPTVSQINATVNANAALHATTLAINKTQGGALIAGQQFGNSNHMYEIGTIVSVVGAVTTVTFLPPLRAALAAGDPIKFTRPTQLVRCMNLNDEFRKLEQLRFATLNLEFVEYL